MVVGEEGAEDAEDAEVVAGSANLSLPLIEVRIGLELNFLAGIDASEYSLDRNSQKSVLFDPIKKGKVFGCSRQLVQRSAPV